MCMLGCAYGVVVAKRWLSTLAMAMVVFDAISNQIINTGLSNVERRSALRHRDRAFTSRWRIVLQFIYLHVNEVIKFKFVVAVFDQSTVILVWYFPIVYTQPTRKETNSISAIYWPIVPSLLLNLRYSCMRVCAWKIRYFYL